MNSRFDRRRFLGRAGLGAAALVTTSASAIANSANSGSQGEPAGFGGASRRGPDVEIALTAHAGSVRLFQGAPTRVWSYRGAVLRGHPGSLLPVPNSYLGPIIRVRRGQRVRIHLRNHLPEATNIHWHGLRVPPEMDGHPGDVIAPGGSFTYEFQVLNRAGTYWYHPHPEMLTGGQAYRGLAGLFIVSDEEEGAVDLPSGPFDIPLVIQDRMVEGNQFAYPSDDLTRMMGFLGDRILVNGRPDYALGVATRPYRLRLLNGSNSRIYKLAWGDGTPLTVIGTDGGLLETPVTREYVTLGPGERVELWADFSGRTLGSTVELRSLEFSGAEGDGTMTAAAMDEPLPNGASFRVMRFRVAQRSRRGPTLPTTLSTVDRYRLEDAVNGDNPRSIGLSLREMQWLLNGRKFEMDEVADDEIVRLNTLEAWEFVNELNPNEEMERMGMVHPMHIHGVQFQVIERQVLPELAMGWDSVREGYVDEGWKDTVLVMPGERVKVLLRFQDYAGRFVYHCHNLEHEDMGMMRNYLIQA
jgi:FtsP/CotA-like multicopper oxidase with cupredoxin domain